MRYDPPAKRFWCSHNFLSQLLSVFHFSTCQKRMPCLVETMAEVSAWKVSVWCLQGKGIVRFVNLWAISYLRKEQCVTFYSYFYGSRVCFYVGLSCKMMLFSVSKISVKRLISCVKVFYMQTDIICFTLEKLLLTVTCEQVLIQ